MKNSLLIAFALLITTTLLAQGKYTASRTAPEPPYPSALFRSIDGTYFDLEHDNTSSVSGHLNILNWLKGRVAGLQVYTYNGNFIPVIRNYPATVYVDEIRIEASFLSMLSVEDIALVKIMKIPSILSARGGVIAIYTKRGEADEEGEEIER